MLCALRCIYESDWKRRGDTGDEEVGMMLTRKHVPAWRLGFCSIDHRVEVPDFWSKQHCPSALINQDCLEISYFSHLHVCLCLW